MNKFERIEELERAVQRLEQRVHTLEKLAQVGELFRPNAPEHMEEELVNRYGDYVDKSATARILGVTRATVYAMLADGRLEGAHGGKRVKVRSIARYMYSPIGMRKHRGMKNGRDADAACSNANRATE